MSLNILHVTYLTVFNISLVLSKEEEYLRVESWNKRYEMSCFAGLILMFCFKTVHDESINQNQSIKMYL